MFGSNDSLEGNWLTKTQENKQPGAGCATERSKIKTSLVICATLFDVIIVLAVATLEYYFRWTDIFPIRRRKVNFSCFNNSDFEQELDFEFRDFWLKAKIPEIFIYIYSFSFPIIIILVGEVLVFVLANQSAKLLPGGSCSPLHIPHTIRRLYRFSLSFLFGILCLMVIIDSIKITMGQLRPNFYSLCPPSPCNNNSYVATSSVLDTDDICQETSILVMRKAKTSCPSMRSAISMYAALFTTSYLHGIGSIHHSKYLFLPLLNLTQILLSIMLGICLVVIKEAWWSDIIIGHILGAALALYMTFCVLRRFKFQETVSTRRILRQLALTQSGRHKECKDTPKLIDACLEPVRLRRPHAQCTSYQCNCVFNPPLTSVLTCNNTEDTSTFFPVSKPNRKSVTLPISSPHIPMNHFSGDKPEVHDHKSYKSENRLSAVNISRRHIILSQNIPKISQELINLLNSKQEPQLPVKEFVTPTNNDQPDANDL